MSTVSAGLQSSTNANDFFNLTSSIFLPNLTSNDGAKSQHLPSPHRMQAPEVIGFTDLQPERAGVDFGQSSSFKYTNNDNDILKDCTLMVALSALTATGGGTNARYIDDVMAGAIDHVDFTYGGQILQTLYGDEMHYRFIQETEHDEYCRQAKLSAENLSDAERIVLARSTQYIAYEIPFWWTKKPENHWHQYAMQRLTRINFYFRPANLLLEQTGVNSQPTATNGTYIVNHFLRFEVSCPSAATKQLYTSLVQQQGKTGLNYLIQDTQRYTDLSLPSGTQNSWSALLNTFTKYAYNIRFWIRPTANLQSDFTNNNRWVLVDIPQYNFDISGKRYLQDIDTFWAKHGLNGKYYLGNEELPIYSVFLTDYPAVSTHGMGGIEFSNSVNPTLNITFQGATTATNYSVDVYTENHNYVRLILDGARSAADTIQPL